MIKTPLNINKSNNIDNDNSNNIIIDNNEIIPKVIVGIDFGTAGIGYAYSFYNNPLNIILSDFNGQTGDKKVPSEIILDKKLEDTLAFGNDCKGYIKTHEKNTYEYFKNIKMNLYKKKDTIKSTNGTEANIENIITNILKQISQHAFTQIKKANDNSIKFEEIKWVVTIPAIWEEKSKEIMIRSSKKAGLINRNTDLSLFLALEPEVAAIYYNSEMSSFKDIHISEGKPYIICDIGAGTVDICTHRKIEMNDLDSQLIEEYPPIGGDYGGNKINEEFIKRLIVEIFGEENVIKLQNDENNEDWDEFESNIENLKKIFDKNEPCNMKLDFLLFEDESIDKTLQDYINEYNLKSH